MMQESAQETQGNIAYNRYVDGFWLWKASRFKKDFGGFQDRKDVFWFEFKKLQLAGFSEQRLSKYQDLTNQGFDS